MEAQHNYNFFKYAFGPCDPFIWPLCVLNENYIKIKKSWVVVETTLYKFVSAIMNWIMTKNIENEFIIFIKKMS